MYILHTFEVRAACKYYEGNQRELLLRANIITINVTISDPVSLVYSHVFSAFSQAAGKIFIFSHVNKRAAAQTVEEEQLIKSLLTLIIPLTLWILFFILGKHTVKLIHFKVSKQGGHCFKTLHIYSY